MSFPFGSTPAQAAEQPPSSTDYAQCGFGRRLGLLQATSADQQEPARPSAAATNALSESFGSYAVGMRESHVMWPQQSASSTVPEPGTKADELNLKTKKALGASVIAEEGEGVVTFLSHKDSEFRYRLTLLGSERIQVWIEDCVSKHQWESKELGLSEIVPADNAIPAMGLKDYFETHCADLELSGATQSFMSCLLAPEGELYQGVNKRDLISLNDNSSDLQLELTLIFQVFSKVLTPTYKFTLHAVKLSEMDILNAKIRDQDEEINELRAQIEALGCKVSSLNTTTTAPLQRVSERAFADASATYYRAETDAITAPTRVMVWRETDYSAGFSAFRVLESGTIRFSRAGIFSIQVVIHHMNCWDPADIKEGFKGSSPQREAFELLKNGQKLVSSFGSTVKGNILSTPLAHILSMEEGGELSVVYTGNGIARKGSYIIITKVR